MRKVTRAIIAVLIVILVSLGGVSETPLWEIIENNCNDVRSFGDIAYLLQSNCNVWVLGSKKRISNVSSVYP